MFPNLATKSPQFALNRRNWDHIRLTRQVQFLGGTNAEYSLVKVMESNLSHFKIMSEGKPAYINTFSVTVFVYFSLDQIWTKVCGCKLMTGKWLGRNLSLHLGVCIFHGICLIISTSELTLVREVRIRDFHILNPQRFNYYFGNLKAWCEPTLIKKRIWQDVWVGQFTSWLLHCYRSDKRKPRKLGENGLPKWYDRIPMLWLS